MSPSLSHPRQSGSPSAAVAEDVHLKVDRLEEELAESKALVEFWKDKHRKLQRESKERDSEQSSQPIVDSDRPPQDSELASELEATMTQLDEQTETISILQAENESLREENTLLGWIKFGYKNYVESDYHELNKEIKGYSIKSGAPMREKPLFDVEDWARQQIQLQSVRQSADNFQPDNEESGFTASGGVFLHVDHREDADDEQEGDSIKQDEHQVSTPSHHVTPTVADTKAETAKPKWADMPDDDDLEIPQHVIDSNKGGLAQVFRRATMAAIEARMNKAKDKKAESQDSVSATKSTLRANAPDFIASPAEGSSRVSRAPDTSGSNMAQSKKKPEAAVDESEDVAPNADHSKTTAQAETPKTSQPHEQPATVPATSSRDQMDLVKPEKTSKSAAADAGKAELEQSQWAKPADKAKKANIPPSSLPAPAKPPQRDPTAQMPMSTNRLKDLLTEGYAKLTQLNRQRVALVAGAGSGDTGLAKRRQALDMEIKKVRDQLAILNSKLTPSASASVVQPAPVVPARIVKPPAPTVEDERKFDVPPAGSRPVKLEDFIKPSKEDGQGTQSRKDKKSYTGPTPKPPRLEQTATPLTAAWHELKNNPQAADQRIFDEREQRAKARDNGNRVTHAEQHEAMVANAIWKPRSTNTSLAPTTDNGAAMDTPAVTVPSTIIAEPQANPFPVPDRYSGNGVEVEATFTLDELKDHAAAGDYAAIAYLAESDNESLEHTAEEAAQAKEYEDAEEERIHKQALEKRSNRTFDGPKRPQQNRPTANKAPSGAQGGGNRGRGNQIQRTDNVDPTPHVYEPRTRKIGSNHQARPRKDQDTRSSKGPKPNTTAAAPPLTPKPIGRYGNLGDETECP